MLMSRAKPVKWQYDHLGFITYLLWSSLYVQRCQHSTILRQAQQMLLTLSADLATPALLIAAVLSYAMHRIAQFHISLCHCKQVPCAQLVMPRPQG